MNSRRDFTGSCVHNRASCLGNLAQQGCAVPQARDGRKPPEKPSLAFFRFGGRYSYAVDGCFPFLAFRLHR